MLVTGRPYALGGVAGRLAAVVQAFFPGEEGGRAIAGVLSGRVTPSGKLPVEIPRDAGGQPSTYLRARNAALPTGSSVGPTPLFAFGYGLARVPLEPGQAAAVVFTIHADRTSFTGQDLTRIVEPGSITVTVGGSSDDLPLMSSFTMTGPLRTVGIDRVLDTPASVKKLTG